MSRACATVPTEHGGVDVPRLDMQIFMHVVPTCPVLPVPPAATHLIVFPIPVTAVASALAAPS